MYDVGDKIGKRYQIQGTCNDSGGMGELLFVSDTLGEYSEQLVLKYCREIGEEQITRFRREVRLLSEYKGNEKVVQLYDFNLDHEPPYFVMKFYKNGDLTRIVKKLSENPRQQEKIFLSMIDCIAELHSRNQYHRDINPQNFLIDDEGTVLVSDFGLSMEVESGTGLTRSSMYWGTHGYLPPEFLNHGGFKNADAMGDIFMLGKSYYVLLTGRDPMYLFPDKIEPPLFHVIERACAVNKKNRYQSLSELKQSLVIAYDVILHRGGGLGETQQLLSAINDRLEQEQRYKSSEIVDFIERLSLLDLQDKIRICYEINKAFYFALRQSPVVDRLSEFLDVYKEMVENENYSWPYAETIASNMQVLFEGKEVPNKQKSFALELAIDAAYRMNRFAAMAICRSMITSVMDDILGLEVASVILKNRHTFIKIIEPSECKSIPIRNALNIIKKEAKNDL